MATAGDGIGVEVGFDLPNTIC